jgi:thiol-disulfide isomerase/thioredoxin
MGKAERIRRMNAREKIIAQQAAARRAEARKKMITASSAVIGVLVIVIGLIVWKSATGGSASTGGLTPAESVTKQIQTVPVSTLNSVGAGSASKLIATTGQARLTSGGKPEIVYMGAEYCPYCAAERWAMVVALSRFGTFSNLQYIHSDAEDVYPNTPTLSFYKSTYTSKYVDFEPVEMEGLTEGSALQTPTSAQSALMSKFDAAPYVPKADAGSFPFLDIGNQYLVIGAQYIPSDLSKLTWAQVATDMRNPSSTVAKDIDGAANTITAGICKITPDAPAGICTSAGVKAGAGAL